MTFSCPAASLREALALAKRFGYAGIELRLGQGHGHGIEVEAGPARRAELRRTAEGEGVALCCLATSCRYADPAGREEQLAQTRRVIELAADVGCPLIRVFGGPLPKGLAREEAIEGVSLSLKALSGFSRERKVTVCLETHDDWCDPEHVAEVLRRVDDSGVAVNWDFMHPFRQAGTAVERSYETLKPWIRHVHFHDGTGPGGELKLLPAGEGQVDVRGAFRLLKEAGYSGFISGEWIDWEPAEIHLPRELAAVRSFEAS